MGETENMEKYLLTKQTEEERESCLGNINSSSGVYTEEVKKLGKIAAPMVAVNLSQYFLQAISVMMVGHLGELYLSSTAIAISFCAVTGFSLLYGMSTAMETLCGQAFGAKEYYKLVVGYVFSNENEVVDYVTDIAPLVCLCVILNGLQAVLSGIARGSGWQDLGAYVHLVAYYLCGIPIAVLLGFWLQMRGKGLWIGLQVQATKARERIFEGRTSEDERA